MRAMSFQSRGAVAAGRGSIPRIGRSTRRRPRICRCRQMIAAGNFRPDLVEVNPRDAFAMEEWVRVLDMAMDFVEQLDASGGEHLLVATMPAPATSRIEAGQPSEMNRSAYLIIFTRTLICRF